MGRPLLVRCAWCLRYRDGALWVVDVPASCAPQTTHGICPDCLARLVAPPRGR